jgi:hypothetical protein
LPRSASAGAKPLAALKTNEPDLVRFTALSPAAPPELSTLSFATPTNFRLATVWLSGRANPLALTPTAAPLWTRTLLCL